MSVLREYLDYTKPTGWSTRVRECDNCVGQGNSLAVQLTRKEDGFLWHCFRCTRSGFFDDTGASPSQAQAIVKAQLSAQKDNLRPDKVSLPADYTTAIPPSGLVFMYDMELEPDDITKNEIGWSPSHKRIIIPVYQYRPVKRLVGLMGRILPDDSKDKPKWWSCRQVDIKHPRFIALSETTEKSRRVSIVEDIFSAIKCAKATGTLSIALLTTYLPYELYPILRGWEVKLWLDADALDKAYKYQSKLGSNGVTADVIYTPADPKDTPLETIKEKLTWT